MSLALVSEVTALLPLLVLSTLGTAALRERFEGLRPFAAAVSILFLAVAAILILPAARWLTGVLGERSRRQSYRLVARIVATGGVLVGVYVFFAAAPGGPTSSDSWAEVVGAVVGLWFGLTALALLGDGLLWRFVWVASTALIAASAVVTIT